MSEPNNDGLCVNLKILIRQAEQGFKGFPIGTLAFYGADNHSASKAIAMVIGNEQGDVIDKQEYVLTNVDIRTEDLLISVINDWFAQYQVATIATSPDIVDCPHEAGIDYEAGTDCPHCPYWKGKPSLAGLRD